jgi:hypothetical protein
VRQYLEISASISLLKAKGKGERPVTYSDQQITPGWDNQTVRDDNTTGDPLTADHIKTII